MRILMVKAYITAMRKLLLGVLLLAGCATARGPVDLMGARDADEDRGR
jgi:hypothetical protein